MKMMNLEVPPYFETEDPIEKEWDNEEHSSEFEEKYSPKRPSPEKDLEFVDTDDTSPPSQRRRPPLPRTRKSSNENVSTLNKNNVESYHSYNTNSHAALKAPKNSFESSHKNEIFPGVDETIYDQTKQSLLKESVIPRKDESNPREGNVTIDSGFNLDFSSKLTIDDTQGPSESNYDNYNLTSHNVPNQFHFNTPNYESIDRKHSVPIPVPKTVSSGDQSNLSVNIDDTDRMLHSFIRHDPPPLSSTQNLTEILASNTPQHFLFPNAFEQNKHLLNGFMSDNPQLGLKNSSLQSPISPETSLPFQNVSPNEMSVGKEMIGHQMSPQSPPFLLPYAMNIQNNQEASNNLQPNSNVPSQMTYPSAPPGYTLLQQTIRAVPPGMNQYGYNSTNTMVPNASSMISNTSSMIPNTNTIMPNTSSMVPNTNTMMLNTISMMPNTNTMMPNTSSVVPNKNVMMPNTSSMVPNTNVMMPNTSSVVPNTNAMMPNTSSMVPNTNAMMPNTSSMVPNTMIATDLRNLLPQQYQAVTLNACDPFQLAHLVNSSVSPKEQKNELHFSPNENQSPMIAAQNQLQMLQQYQLQMMTAPNQHQMNMMRENPVPKPVVELPQENNQQMTEPGNQQPSGKTRDELQQEYLQAMQYVNHLQQQLASAAQHSQGPYGFSPMSLPITNNMFHPGMQMMSLSQQPLPQVPTTTGQLSPITSTSLSNIHSLINSEAGLIQSTSDPTVGRGRGRLQ